MAADEYSSIFTTSPSPDPGVLTYPQLEARRRIAIALATRNRPYPKTIGEGLTALGEGLGEGYMNSGLASAERAQQAKDAGGQRLLDGGTAPVPAAPGRISEAPADNVLASYTGAASEDGQPVKLATADTQPLTPEQASQQPQMPVEELLQRFARNETGGQKDPYRSIGPVSRRGDYPYGKYQIMGENIGPWSKKYLGREITPQEFLADDKAQEQIARGKGSEYMAKYGPQGAARAWFAGENGMNDMKRKDTLGTHVAEYERRFNIPLVTRDQVVASAAKQQPALAPDVADAGMAMAYAPEGASEQPPVEQASLGGGAADMLSTLSNPQPPGLGLRGPSDSTFPVPSAPPPVSRDSISASVAAQNGITPPQQVAQAGPAPIPQAAPALPPGVPTVTPQTLPPEPVQPARPADPGPEPKLDRFLNEPAMKRRIDAANSVYGNNAYSDLLRAQAKDKLKELHDIARDEHTKQWTVWHEAKKISDAERLNREEKDLQTAKLRGETYDAAEKRVLVQRLGGQDPQKFFDNLGKEQTLAEVAGKVRDDNRTILKAVNDGVIMGWGSGLRINAAKLASFAFNNGYSSEQAANTEILRALGGSRIRESLSQINPTGTTSNTDTALARQLPGADPAMEPKSFMALLHKSSEGNAKLINEYEDKKDYYLGGTRAERQFDIAHPRTAPPAATDAMLANRDDKALRAKYDDTYGEGSSALEIERFKRRQRRGG